MSFLSQFFAKFFVTENRLDVIIQSGASLSSWYVMFKEKFRCFYSAAKTTWVVLK